MDSPSDDIVVELTSEEAWDLFLRMAYSPQEDSCHSRSVMQKLAKALGTEWAVSAAPSPTSR